MTAKLLLDVLKGKAKVTPKNIREALQQAIEIEIATIPVYLYTYYSIDRTPDQDKITADLTKRLEKACMHKQEAEKKALELSAAIMVFANKAGALIMSVAVEEMLHMSLSSNVKQAIVGPPELVYKSPSQWPAHLPGHEPPFPINRAAFSQHQLYTFLLIESPKPIVHKDEHAQAIPYVTIGEFYGMIEECIRKHYRDPDNYNTERPQLVPDRGYYAQNNIDTVFYNEVHKPKFVNAADSGDLVHVCDMKSALQALEEIVEQGEGHKHGASSLGPHGRVDCDGIKPGDFDDRKHQELSHFAKFRELYCELGEMKDTFNKVLGTTDFDPSQYYVINVPENPSTSDYPKPIQAVSNLTNAVYTYLYVLTEECYHQDGDTQFEIFMFGIHKGMLWILSSLCGEMTGMQYVAPDGKTYNAAPTFEDYRFSDACSPKSQIIELYNQAVGAYGGLSYIGQRIHDLPNVPIQPYLEAGESKSIIAG